MRLELALFAVSVTPILAGEHAAAPEHLTGPEVLARVAHADTARSEALQNYTAVRKYVLTNKRFDKHAEVLVRVNYAYPGTKKFDVLSETGPALLRNRVLRRMLDAEEEGSRDDRRPLSRISAENYDAELAGIETVDGRPSYVLNLKPRSRSPYLIRGQAWVDAEDFAVVRLAGVLAKSPSFWTRETHIDHRYSKRGPFWLPASDHSDTDVVFFGKSEVTIECIDYEVNRAPGTAVTAAERR